MKSNHEHYVIIDTNDFSVNVCHSKAEIATTLRKHRNTLTNMPARAIFNSLIGDTKHNFLVITV